MALRANVNVPDRSRNTHAVFLALAAADPASPGSTPASLAARSNAKAIPFPVAELLVQNGAEIPPQPPSIPLSPAAQLYLSQRTARNSAFSAPSPAAKAAAKAAASDTLGSLPTIRGSSRDSSASSGSQMPNSDTKEKDKLSKRGSAGARFAGKVASLRD